MPYHDSPSPARRPQLMERNSSTQSVSRGSPSAALLNKHSTSKKHMAHAVGHHRHSHNRISSYGKNLNKLSRVGVAHPADGSTSQKHHARTKSQTPTSSPTSQQIKRNSSNISLVRAGSKASLKGNLLSTSLKHNVSGTKLGHASKPQLRPHSRNGSSRDLPLRGKAKFSMGDEDPDEPDEPDDECVEASGSQSPNAPKQTPKTLVKSPLEAPPSPDDPPGRSSPVLPHSPPQSPPLNESRFPAYESIGRKPAPSGQYSHPPDSEIVTHRLLNRHRPHNAAPQMSTISATITPSGSNGSPAFNHSQGFTLVNDPSMPPDGISRFLNTTGSSSGSATPGSVVQLQSALANIHRNHHHDHDPTCDSPPRRNTMDGPRRAKSAANLSMSTYPDGEDHAPSPPSPHVAAPNNTRASPFKSAQEPREAAKSLTQLKLDLQRMSTNREPAQAPAVQPPLAMIYGAHAIANMGGITGERSADRKVRQWEQAGLEFRNGRRFNDMLINGVGRLEKRRDKKKAPRTERDEERTKIGAATGARPASRGRVRFEVGRREGEDEEDEEDEGGGVQDLLKRMWEGSGGE